MIQLTRIKQQATSNKQQATSNKQQATKLISFLLLLALITFSCKKNSSQNTNNTNINYSIANSTLQTGSGAEGIIEFAPQTTNPFTLANMQAALDSLTLRNTLDCDKSRFVIRTTHKYIKFKPIDSIEANLLALDTTLILFDYPLDRKITKGGTYYRTPDLPANQPNYQWTCVPVNKALPTNVTYDVIANLYLPEEDPNLVQYYNTTFDNCITQLIDEALLRTGNYDTTSDYSGVTSSGSSKWTPAGNISMFDDFESTNKAIKGVKVRVCKWFEIREQLTDNNGNYNIGHTFRSPVNYSVKWDRNDYNIRSGSHGQAYFNGPRKKGNWDLNINSGLSRMFAIIHRAVHRYYYEGAAARENLRVPPLASNTFGKITIGAYEWNNTSSYGCLNMAYRYTTFPEIRIYTPANNCAQIYATTIHELCHAAHWDLGKIDFSYTNQKVKESWARGVQWSLTKLEYPSYKGGAKYLPLYTLVVVDMLDNASLELFPSNTGQSIADGDLVNGYTIKEIQDALQGQRTWFGWKDNIKNKYTNATENNLDALFNHWF